MEHSVVTALDGRFAGWPANNGAWGFDGGQEVLALGGFPEAAELRPWVRLLQPHDQVSFVRPYM